MTLLDKSRIADELSRWELVYFDEVDSTNAFLMLQQNPVNMLCTAESQTAGRGRRSRVWISPHARSLSISLGWSTARSAQELGAVSLVVGVAVAETLQQLGAMEIGLKWPNDVHLEGFKLCGILVELKSTAVPACLIIGFGVNVDLTEEEISVVNQPVTDLKRVGAGADRTSVLIDLVNAVTKALEEYEALGLTPFMGRFNALHTYHGRRVNLIQGQGVISGRVLGIQRDGALLLETETGATPFYGGEVSLRPAD